MATVTGATAARVAALEGELIDTIQLVGKNLVITKKNDSKILVENIVPPILDAYPVGSIYMTDRSANPSTYMGGTSTWVRWGKGRVPVSIDEAQAEFDSIEETGGSKTHTLTINEMPSHGHNVHPVHINTRSGDAQALIGSGSTFGFRFTTEEMLQGGGAEHNIMQPYITCYMWKRTA